MSPSTLRVKSRSTPRKPISQHRVCKRPGCDKRLSMYNPNDYCFTHFRKIVSADYSYL